MALVLAAPAGSALSLYLTLILLLAAGLCVAPPATRRDKRVIVGIGLGVLAAIGVPLSAFVCATCSACESWLLLLIGWCV